MNGLSKTRSLVLRIFVLVCLAAAMCRASAHGGVSLAEDMCAIQIGIYKARFKEFQPSLHGHKQYCEDLPDAAETVFVMEYIHGALGEVPVEFRIIKDVTGHGRNATAADIQRAGNLDKATVFYQPPTVKKDVLTVVKDFKQPGWYIGIVTARHPTLNRVYTAVFPFKVGFAGFGWWPPLVGIAILVQLGYWFSTGRLARWRARLAAGGLPGLLGAQSQPERSHP